MYHRYIDTLNAVNEKKKYSMFNLHILWKAEECKRALVFSFNGSAASTISHMRHCGSKEK